MATFCTPEIVQIADTLFVVAKIPRLTDLKMTTVQLSHDPPSGSRFSVNSITVVCALLLLATLFGPLAAQASVQEETIHVPGPIPRLQLGLRHAGPSTTDSILGKHAVVLMLHGAGAAVSANPDFHQGGRSMMLALAESGLDVWALDFYGFGESDRYPEMMEPADNHPPLGRAEECADQVQSAVSFLRDQQHVEQVMLLGDSGGSLVAGIYATRQPQRVSRLVLFGPMTPFTLGPPPDTTIPAYILITPDSLWGQFADWATAAGIPSVLDPAEYESWSKAFLQSDPTSKTRSPPSVKVPNGRQADTQEIEKGHFPYDPSKIHAPTLIVMGEWDAISTFQGAEWLLKSLVGAPQRQLLVIGHGSHTIQYEKERNQLYRAVIDFLTEGG